MHNSTVFSLFLALSTGTAFAQQAAAPYSAVGKKAQVDAIAANTNLRLTAQPELSFQPAGQPLTTEVCVFVGPNHTFQTMLGIGGALTDASAKTFAKLPKPQQQELLKAYYSPNAGIGYTPARTSTSIHNSDFSSGSYTYVTDKDEELKTFSVKHDEQFCIPFIKQAQAAAPTMPATSASRPSLPLRP